MVRPLLAAERPLFMWNHAARREVALSLHIAWLGVHAQSGLPISDDALLEVLELFSQEGKCRTTNNPMH